jgi:hypothetical protein
MTTSMSVPYIADRCGAVASRMAAAVTGCVYGEASAEYREDALRNSRSLDGAGKVAIRQYRPTPKRLLVT